jgi:hypothetical protein
MYIGSPINTTMRKIEFVRINENFEPYITVDNLVKGEDKTVKAHGGTFRLTSYTDEEGNEYFSFGYMVDDVKQRPGHGGEWSSNSKAINEVFGIDLIECAIKELKGQYSSFFAMAIKRSNVSLPYNLELRENYGFNSIMLKPGFEYPSGTDYFRSTKLDADGNLIYPLVKKEA